ncbi:hypothetical protein ACYULU_08375 [Breznakiellaceae bacterium SP9]
MYSSLLGDNAVAEEAGTSIRVVRGEDDRAAVLQVVHEAVVVHGAGLFAQGAFGAAGVEEDRLLL